MAPRKRKFGDFDPNKSDSDDLDYGAKSPSSQQARSKKTSRKSSAAPPKPKRRRKSYGDESDDIEVNSAEPSDEEASFAEDSEEEEEQTEVNPRTGRSVRTAAKKPVKYEEPSDEESDEAADTEETPPPRAGQVSKQPKGKFEPTSGGRKLIVKLSVPRLAMAPPQPTRSRTGSKSTGPKRSRQPTPASSTGVRKSSRISRSEEPDLISLAYSGKQGTVSRATTNTPEPSTTRPTRGGKGLKSVPSAIMEVSQEDIATQVGNEEAFMAQLAQVAGTGGSTTQVNKEEAASAGEESENIQMEEVVQESENEEDEAPVKRGGRTAAHSRRKASTPSASQAQASKKRKAQDMSSDFEPDADGDGSNSADDMSDDELPPHKRARGRSSNDESAAEHPTKRGGRKSTSTRSRARSKGSDEEADEELDPEEVADEAMELEEDRQRNRRPRKRVAQSSEIAYETNLRSRGQRPDYRIYRPELAQNFEDDEVAAPAPTTTPQRKGRGGGAAAGYRSLFSTFGPFGGAGGPTPVLGGPEGVGAVGDVDSDSSDDEGQMRGGQHGVGGPMGMTPTSAAPKLYVPQALAGDVAQGTGGGPSGLGKIKDRKALADADPLGVDPNVSFEGVGGLDDHIDRLKEMVALPLLYPEVFQRFKVTPPRGVLFHGPPGTGKTLLARALASSVSSQGKKVTFYMRKGADALSKWVGEAEKQLRMLFEEARKNQPSIIFFDEIDGLAPVRSSKQEQIHASIVATLLALMDGMDGRGQVIVIGATNRPDSVDPALRRPGRFDREFYFPLPDQKARRAILDIHTKGWEPPLPDKFKDSLSELTRGYGGADLRALCTEAALNAVQGTYPQIYSSDQKLVIDPSTIKVTAKDFMISVNKIVPSSERSAASGAAPLKREVEPLLRKPLHDVANLVEEAIPRKRKATALEEAMFDDRDDDAGFEKETMQRQFEAARIFRPRLLIKGLHGMGQQYLGAALLTRLEGLHVQNFELAALMKDSTRSAEAAVIQQFEEVKRHKPSVIYIPNVDVWYRTLEKSVIRTFTGMLRSLAPTEPVLLLGMMEQDPEEDDDVRDSNAAMMRDLFGFSKKNQYDIQRPDDPARREYFDFVVDYIRKAPTDFPNPESRKRRKLATLPVAPPPPPPPGPSKEEFQAQKKRDRHTLNALKINIQSVMDQIKLKYRKFRTPIVDDRTIAYLYDEQNPEMLTTDLGEQQRQEQNLFRPYELDKDDKGVPGLREVASGKFYYNLEIVTIENRLSNGYYKRPKDFLQDIRRLAKDAKVSGDHDRTLKANEMLANVEVDMTMLEQTQPALVAECERVYEREQAREKERVEKARQAQQQGQGSRRIIPNVPPMVASNTTTETSGPVMLGEQVPGRHTLLPPITPARFASSVTPWSTSNGSMSNQTNGSTVPSRPAEPSDLVDSQFGVDAPTERNTSLAQTRIHTQDTSGQRSQRSAVMQIAPGTQPSEYQNSASTTSSGNKTSDPSNRSSDPYTQPSNGTGGDGPDISNLPPISGSQLPDTQEFHFQSSQSQPSQSSQPMAPPPAPPRQSISAVLNEPVEGGAEAPANRIILDARFLKDLHTELVRRSSGLSVEQLEQVNAGLMDVIWNTRTEWNRTQVCGRVKDAFNETIRDIEACQKIAAPSQEH